MTLAVLAFGLVGCDTPTVEGSGGKELTLVTPGDVTIQRGRSEKVEFQIERRNTREAVTVSISRLPDGVSTRSMSQTTEADSVMFILEADHDAALVTNQAVAVNIESRDGLRGTEYMRLTVVEP